jgi:hypothetical protein
MSAFLILLVIVFIGKGMSYLFDGVSSVIPGWHTTIYSPWEVVFGVMLTFASLFLLILLVMVVKKLSRMK